MNPITFLTSVYIAAAVLFLFARRKAFWGLGGAAATVLFLLLAFALPLDIETISTGVLGLLLCLLLPGRRDRT